MKVVLVLSSCLVLVSCSRRYPQGSSGGGGQFPNGGGAPIIFPGEVNGGGGGGGGHIHNPGGGGGVIGGSPIGHEGEPLYLNACPSRLSLVSTSFQGINYHFSWCNDGGKRYDWQGASNYCLRLGGGWEPLSIRNSKENSFIVGIIERNRLPWIWTGGNRLHTKGNNFEWFDGSKLTYTNWGQTGSANIPQPDNAENNNERCLSLLNQFYRNDFITWHDIGCHHDKPTICKQTNQQQYG